MIFDLLTTGMPVIRASSYVGGASGGLWKKSCRLLPITMKQELHHISQTRYWFKMLYWKVIVKKNIYMYMFCSNQLDVTSLIFYEYTCISNNKQMYWLDQLTSTTVCSTDNRITTLHHIVKLSSLATSSDQYKHYTQDNKKEDRNYNRNHNTDCQRFLIWSAFYIGWK